MHDLKGTVNHELVHSVLNICVVGMGENNAVKHRPNYIRRTTLKRAAEIYKSIRLFILGEF